MADLVYSFKTTLSPEDVVVRAVQFFSGTKWRPSGQSSRTATFQGMPPIPWVHITLMVIAFMACIVPGIIYYIYIVQKARKFQNLVVTASPLTNGSEVVINYPSFAANVVTKFTESMPLIEEST